MRAPYRFLARVRDVHCRVFLNFIIVLRSCFCFCTLELHEKDPDAWWNTFEVNIRGSFNFFRCVSRPVSICDVADSDAILTSAAATALEQSGGYFVATSTGGAQVRIPGTSDMNISKHAVNRLIEFIVLGSFFSSWAARKV